MFTHIVLTRFNVRFAANWSRLGLDPTWLRHRFDLFETYCLPSVRSQTCTDFRWIVFFDEGTPVEFIDRVTRITDSWWTPIFVGELTTELVLSTVSAHIHPSADFLITTRLDNDDVLSRDFVARVQAGFQGNREYLNIRNGFILNQGRLYSRHDDQHNPFVTLIEPCTDLFDTVWRTEHTKIAQNAPVRQLEGGPGWIQVVHEKNVLNSVRGTRCPAEKFSEIFAFDRRLLAHEGKLSLSERVLDKFVLMPFRWLAGKTRRVRKQLRLLRIRTSEQ